jgi:recombination protein RecA
MPAKRVTGIKEIDAIAAALNKKFSLGNIITLGPLIQEVETVSTGSLSLDCQLGVGGLPIDRVIEIYGPTSGGKTSLALQICRNYVEKYGYDRPPVFIDLEHTTGVELIRKMGLDPKKIIFAQPDTAEQALSIAEDLGKSGKVGLIIFDSVDAAEAESMSKRDIGGQGMADLPRLMSQAMRRISKLCVKNKVMYLFINQTRSKMTSYGNPETTSGGVALPFYSSVRLRVQSKPDKKSADTLEMKVKVVKNKCAPAMNKEAEFAFRCGYGTNTTQDVLDFARDIGILRYASISTFVTHEGEEEIRVSAAGGKDGARAFYHNPENGEALQKLRASCFNLSGITSGDRNNQEFSGEPTEPADNAGEGAASA